MLGEAELKALSNDIAENGLRQKILRDKHQRIIDGRNRFAACELAGVTPDFDDFDGDDAAVLKLVVSLNLHRRHLNESQRSYVAGQVATMRKGGQKGNANAATEKTNRPIDLFVSEGVTQQQAADTFNVSEKSVRRAVKVQREGIEELNNAVVAGEISVNKAAEIAALNKEEQPAAVQAAKAHKPLPPREPKQTGPVFDMNTAKAEALKAIRGVFRSWPSSAKGHIPTFLRQIAKENW